MATAQEIADEMSRIGGIPPSTVRTIARRLGEASLLPRGGRGKSPQELSARDCARLVVGTMRITDGIDGAAARVDKLVNDVERLRSPGKVSLGIDYDLPKVPIVEPGSFVDQLASLIRRLCTDEKALLTSGVSAVGLTSGLAGLWGWLELRGYGEPSFEDSPQLSQASGKIRVIFGRRDFDYRGLTREVRITSEALCEIAAAWRLGQPPPEGQRMHRGPHRWGGPKRG